MSDFETVAAAIGVAQIKVLDAGLSNVKHDGTDAPKISLQFQQLSHHYDSMQSVLFDAKKFPILHGKSVFDVLPDHSQEAILQLLIELPHLLYFRFALGRKYVGPLTPFRLLQASQHTLACWFGDCY